MRQKNLQIICLLNCTDFIYVCIYIQEIGFLVHTNFSAT